MSDLKVVRRPERDEPDNRLRAYTVMGDRLWMDCLVSESTIIESAEQANELMESPPEQVAWAMDHHGEQIARRMAQLSGVR